MLKYLILIGVIAISCSSRKLENVNLSGVWKLVNIESIEIASNNAIAELLQYPNQLLGDIILKVDNNSQYELSIQTITFSRQGNTQNVTEASTIVTEYGIIVDEKEQEILWSPRRVRDKSKKSSAIISGSKKSGEYFIQYTLGRMPIKPEIYSEYSITGDQLNIVNDYRLSLFKNTTGFRKDDIQLKTRLTFIRMH